MDIIIKLYVTNFCQWTLYTKCFCIYFLVWQKFVVQSLVIIPATATVPFVVKGLAIMPTTVTMALLVMLALATLGVMTQIETILFLSYYPR
jgi:hypothetical protein